jgi:hypothetical protein
MRPCDKPPHAASAAGQWIQSGGWRPRGGDHDHAHENLLAQLAYGQPHLMKVNGCETYWCAQCI